MLDGVLAGMLCRESALGTAPGGKKWPLVDLFDRITGLAVSEHHAEERITWFRHLDRMLDRALHISHANLRAWPQGCPPSDAEAESRQTFALRVVWGVKLHHTDEASRRRVVAAALRFDARPLEDNAVFRQVFIDWAGGVTEGTAKPKRVHDDAVVREDAERFLDAALRGAPDSDVIRAEPRVVRALVARFTETSGRPDQRLANKLLASFDRLLENRCDQATLEAVETVLNRLDGPALLTALPVVNTYPIGALIRGRLEQDGHDPGLRPLVNDCLRAHVQAIPQPASVWAEQSRAQIRRVIDDLIAGKGNPDQRTHDVWELVTWLKGKLDLDQWQASKPPSLTWSAPHAASDAGRDSKHGPDPAPGQGVRSMVTSPGPATRSAQAGHSAQSWGATRRADSEHSTRAGLRPGARPFAPAATPVASSAPSARPSAAGTSRGARPSVLPMPVAAHSVVTHVALDDMPEGSDDSDSQT